MLENEKNVEKYLPGNFIYIAGRSLRKSVFFCGERIRAKKRKCVKKRTNYYAFGLRIAGISSKKLADGTGNEGQVKNEFGYNDKELFDDGDLNWSDYGFRNYDAQIGRFPQLDPLTHDYHFLTPYQYASNDPITNIDLDGLEGVEATIFKGSTQAIATASADMARLAGKEIEEVVVKTSIKKVAAKAAEKAAMKLFNEVLKYTAMLANAALGELQQRNESQQAGQQANSATPEYLKVAIDEIGQREIKGSRNNSRISNDYFGSVNLKGSSDDEMPWCSAFVNWCFTKAGVQGTNSASSQSWRRWKGGTVVSRPSLGDIAVITHANGTGHVAFVTGGDGDRVALLGGNQGMPGGKSNDGVIVNNKWNKITPNMKFIHPNGAPAIPLPKKPIVPVATDKIEQITYKNSR